MNAHSVYDRVLLIGAGGMLAHALSQLLNQRGIPFRGVRRDECDLSRPETLNSCVNDFKPTLVLNGAAYTAVDKCEADSASFIVNGQGVGHLAASCRDVGAKLIHYSTDYVFDGTLRRPLRPDDPVGPVSAYGRSKLLGETLIREKNPPGWLILRTAWLYGPNGNSFPKTMLNAARAGKPLKVVADQVGTPTYTFDLAAATLDLIDAGASGVYHITNSGQTNWFEFTQAIFEEFGVTPTSLTPISSDDWTKMKPDSAVRPAYSVLDLSDYSRRTGKTLPDWRDGLRRYRQAVEPG